MSFLKKKQLLYAMGIVAGIACFILGGISKNSDSNILAGILAGIGAGLFSFSLSTLINHRIEAKHPELKRKKDIEVNDERNVHIKEKAGARTHLISFYAICLLAFVFTILDVEVYVMITLMGLIFLNAALYAIYVNYYSKRL